jgi:outer membrane protein
MSHPSTRRRVSSLALVLAVGLVDGRSPASAQDGPPPPAAPGLTLEEVLRVTLVANPDIRLAAQQAEKSRGALLAAAVPFDAQVQAGGSAVRIHEPDPLDGGEAVQEQLSYKVGLQRLFRNGMSVQPSVGLTRAGFSTWPGSLTSNVASVGLTLSLPLMRDRGGVLSGAPERAAGHDYQSSVLDVRHTTAVRALSAVQAYWDYLASQQRLEVFRSSEERARNIAEQTRVLVDADERTAADLTQTLGNLASKRVARITAEQTVVEGRQQLGLAMGLTAEAIAVLPPPATAFPGLVEAAAGARADPAALLQAAYHRRADLLSAEQDLLAAETLVNASRNELKPRLDLVVVTGYKSATQGPGVSDFFSPLFRHGPKLDGSIQFSYSLPVANSQARGRLAGNASVYEQQRTVRDDIRRRIAAGVALAREALVRGEASTRESVEAVRLLEATVQAQQRKFQLGASTLFDVIQAEDALTNARLAQIQSQRNYAVAIASLRYQSGTLVTGEREQLMVEAGRLQTPP